MQIVFSYALFIAVGAALVALFAAPIFRVSHVTVHGAPRAEAEIAAASGVIGANIFTIRAATVLDAVWRVPDVLPCGVTLSFPNTVTICARPRKPLLAWRTSNSLFLVDKYGRLIRSVTATALPVLRDTTHVPRHLGGSVNPWIATTVQWLLAQMPHAAVAGFTLGVKNGIIIRSRHGWRAILGIPSNSVSLQRRVATLKALIGRGYATGHPLERAILTGSTVLVRFYTPSNGIRAGR